MFENTYKNMNNQIKPDDDLIENTFEMKHNKTKRTKSVVTPFYRRPLVIAAMFFFCVVLATPALASNVPAIYELMYMVSPDVAQFFVPVQESCEDNGIRLEVVSTNIHGNTAEIYVTMQDLTGDRVDETTDLFDSYSIHRNFDSSASCARVGYDAETKTATFMILIEEWGDHDIVGSKLTFSVSEFLSHKINQEDIPSNIDLSELNVTQETQNTHSSIGGINIPPNESSSDSHVVLVPFEPLYYPADGLYVTAFGYVDGKFHIQLATTEKLTFDSHGFYYLLDKEGNKYLYDYSVNFTEGIESDNRVDYQEFVFDIPKEEIGNYKLYGSFYSSGMNTKGKWRVTFPLTVSQQK